MIVFFCFLSTSCSENSESSKLRPEDTSVYTPQVKEKIRQRKLHQLLEMTEGNTIHVPARLKSYNPIFKTKSGVCFDLNKLPEPWYPTSSYRHQGSLLRKTSEGFGLAVVSEALKIPYYRVLLNRSVDYDYVTPGQEYLTVFVQGVSKNDGAAYYDKKLGVIKDNIDSGRFAKSAMKLAEAQNWEFQIFDRSVGSVVVDFSQRAFFEVDLNHDSIMKSVAHETNLPIAGFFGGGLSEEGTYLHSSGKFAVKFNVSARATPNVPQIFSEINNTLNSLVINCKG